MGANLYVIHTVTVIHLHGECGGSVELKVKELLLELCRVK